MSSWLVGGLESCDCPSRLPAGTAASFSDRGQVCGFLGAMDLVLPAAFGTCLSGQRMHLVGRLLCWDPTHDAHLFEAKHSGANFLASGLLDGSGSLYSLMNVEFRKQFPIPLVGIDNDSVTFKHEAPSWDRLHQVVELCAGFGGISQGLATSGFQTAVAVDFNKKFLDLFALQDGPERIVGDVCDLTTLVRVWDVAKGAATLAAGFACQPFSRLGDQKAGDDDRSKCLQGILASAFYLQVHAVVLECVQPASTNSYVVGEIARFLEASGFSCTQCDLSLVDIWPCRRNRAWWLITSPLLGKIPLIPWPQMNQVTKVKQLVPCVQPWDVNDENVLKLSPIEMAAFGTHDETYMKYLLNFESCAPCALHSWGSQVVGCECGCRVSGLSHQRIIEKGLFGCLIRSCSTEFQHSVLRHLHPNEVMMLCAFDPMVDFGRNPRLTLAAAGQMASPMQAAWIFSALDQRIQQLRGYPPKFNSEARLQAYMSWILMRGRQVWPMQTELISDPNLVSLIRFWEPVSGLSLHEVMHPPRWPDLCPLGLNIATLLDHLICMAQTVPRPLSNDSDEVSTDVPMTALDEDWYEEAQTPCLVPEPQSMPGDTTVSPDECLVIFHHEPSDPIKIHVKEGSTIQHLVQAQAQLVGGLTMIDAHDKDGTMVPFTHVLTPGQVIWVRCEEVPSTTEGLSPCGDGIDVSVGSETERTHVATHACGATVSPTAEWTIPAHENAPVQPGFFGPCDAGECPMPTQMLPDCESWISAAPLLGLKDSQFKNLQVPAVTNTKHLWALRHQLLKADDRACILLKQGGVWADDEFRFHISMLLQLRNDRMCAKPDFVFRKVFMLDPLLLTGWLHHGVHLCHEWGSSHPEIKQECMMILSACMIEGHWIPVCLSPQGQQLHFTTWDAPQNSHEKLIKVVEAIANSLGFPSIVSLRHQRLFLATDMCGALAMSFLHHCVFDSMLPTTLKEVEAVHAGYRQAYVDAVNSAQLARRPWVWGSGDAEEVFFNEPGSSSGANAPASGPAVAGTSFSHQCMDKDARMDLLREKGKLWGDDEIRFHLAHLINHKANVCHSDFSPIPGFVMMDPLMLSTWDTIGKDLCAAWCRRHMVVPDQGFHIVSVMLYQEHWFPVWFVPHGRTWLLI